MKENVFETVSKCRKNFKKKSRSAKNFLKGDSTVSSGNISYVITIKTELVKRAAFAPTWMRLFLTL